MKGNPATQPVDTHLQTWTPATLGFVVLMALLMSLNTARAVLSIGTVLLASLALWQWARQGWRWNHMAIPQRRLALAVSSLFGLALLSGLNTGSASDWLAELYLKIPLLLLPLSVALLSSFSRRQRSLLVLSFLGVQTLVALASLVQAAWQYEEMIEEVKRNASVDVITGSSHIYFGLTLAFSACLGIFWFLQRGPVALFARERWLFLTLGLLDFVALHLFTSRTGLVALYAGLAFGGLVYLIQQRAWRLGLVLLLGLTLTPVLAFYLVPSFRIRAEVTRWDFQQYQRPDADLSYNSASLRLLAWETAGQLIRENPLTGVGMRDVKASMEQQYTQNGAYQRARKPLDDPHNLYLYYLVGAGIGALCWLIAVLVYPVLLLRGSAQVLMAAFIGGIAAAMLFESIIQRQIGMSYFAIFYVLIPGLVAAPAEPKQ
jgi:O-antigen ligase